MGIASPRARRFSRTGVASVPASGRVATSGTRPPSGGLLPAAARALAAAENQCSCRISPMKTAVSRVKTNACKNATKISSSMIPVAITDDAAPTA